MSQELTATPSSTVRRAANRAEYDRATAYEVLDEGLVCHVGFVGDDGRPVVIPTTYARRGDRLLLHGSPASRMLRGLGSGIDVCVTVTLLDGLVLARSAFHHSMNYRSVVLFGRATRVEDPAAKVAALDAFVDHLVPGRRPSLREMTEKEVKGTLVLEMAIDEGSAKVRTGPPIDDEEDYTFPVWAGVLPLALTAGAPEPDPRLEGDLETPAEVVGYERSRPGGDPEAGRGAA
ncbi:MAG: pyridoxamine 5'-phosphate oxidase family protein [Actinomycetota bacterium]|nr:pyridoxamine 5'-phosphate oxidase family protein [Actinomycetota bacterium]